MKILHLAIITLCALIGIFSTEFAGAMAANSTAITPPPNPNSSNPVMHSNLTSPALHPTLPSYVAINVTEPTDKTRPIVITGMLYKLFPNMIILKVQNPQGSMVLISQLKPSSSGGFSLSFVPMAPLWSARGNYTVTAFTGSLDLGSTTFYFNGTSYSTSPVPPAHNGALPLEQFRSGIKAQDVTCNNGLQLVIKAEDDSPACIDQSTIPRLIVRNWLSVTLLDQNNTFSGDFYQGIENDSGTARVKNETYYIMTVAGRIEPGKTVQFHGVTFSFPYGWFITPGGGLLPVAMTFPDGATETYGNTQKNSDSTSFSGLSLGPGPSSNGTVTILSNHASPQAGVTLTEDKIKLLVSTDNSELPVTQTPDSPSSLNLYLSTSSQVIKTGQTIGIEISVNNTLSRRITLSDEDSWKVNYLSANPCTTEQYGIAILGGFYSEQNLTGGKPLPIFNPDASCPVYNNTIQSYVFDPSSSHVTLNNCTDNQVACSSGFDMGAHFTFNGIWKYGQIQPFSPGLYTVVGGDEWGHLSIEHFTVTNHTGS